jgi:catechol 2,3-dioxygenase-like lactoylglutathione lyase family enzyme
MRVRPIHFVPDVDEALRFYEALGLRIQARARTGRWIELAASGGELALHDATTAPAMVKDERGR